MLDRKKRESVAVSRDDSGNPQKLTLRPVKGNGDEVITEQWSELLHPNARAWCRAGLDAGSGFGNSCRGEKGRLSQEAWLTNAVHSFLGPYANPTRDDLIREQVRLHKNYRSYQSQLHFVCWPLMLLLVLQTFVTPMFSTDAVLELCQRCESNGLRLTSHLLQSRRMAIPTCYSVRFRPNLKNEIDPRRSEVEVSLALIASNFPQHRLWLHKATSNISR